MGTWTIELTAAEEEAILTRTGDVQKELNNVVSAGIAPTVANYQAEQAEQQKAEAVDFKVKFETLKDEVLKKQVVDAIAAAVEASDPPGPPGEVKP